MSVVVVVFVCVCVFFYLFCISENPYCFVVFSVIRWTFQSPVATEQAYNPGPKTAASATVIRDSVISVPVSGGKCDVTEMALQQTTVVRFYLKA